MVKRVGLSQSDFKRHLFKKTPEFSPKTLGGITKTDILLPFLDLVRSKGSCSPGNTEQFRLCKSESVDMFLKVFKNMKRSYSFIHSFIHKRA